MSENDKKDAWPHWVNNLHVALAICPQIVLSGNIRDLYLIPDGDKEELLPLLPTLWASFKARGYMGMLIYDQVDGLVPYPWCDRDGTPDEVSKAQKEIKRAIGDIVAFSAAPNHRVTLKNFDELRDVIRGIVCYKEANLAIVVDYASRLRDPRREVGSDVHGLFVTCEKLGHDVKPVGMEVPSPPAGGVGGAAKPPETKKYRWLYNPLIWVVNAETHLPAWYTAGNEHVRIVNIPLPDHDARIKVAERLASSFGQTPAENRNREQTIKVFADCSDDLTLRGMQASQRIATLRGWGLDRAADAVRLYRFGVIENPWRQDHLHDVISKGEGKLRERVKGQEEAIRSTLSILCRSVMGLSGAHAGSRLGRPRGVLFFAGPTGVGKTELAKALTEIIFGSEDAYIRFDMSEFSAEHSDQRLIGAPPSYVGYEQGGELTNAIRRKPFSVILFDEIEKAHPRILDKFLQILEDGRLTDGRGDTVYFSEAIIIFTTNLGISEEYVDEHKRTQRVPLVTYETPPDKMKETVRKAIKDYFMFKLGRPELLNRIGDNITVFNFIGRKVGEEIFSKMKKAIARRIKEEHGLVMVLQKEVETELCKHCLENLDMGGRGIGNTLETVFINPLAEALFSAGSTLKRGSTVTVTGFRRRTQDDSTFYELDLK